MRRQRHPTERSKLTCAPFTRGTYLTERNRRPAERSATWPLFHRFPFDVPLLSVRAVPSVSASRVCWVRVCVLSVAPVETDLHFFLRAEIKKKKKFKFRPEWTTNQKRILAADCDRNEWPLQAAHHEPLCKFRVWMSHQPSQTCTPRAYRCRRRLRPTNPPSTFAICASKSPTLSFEYFNWVTDKRIHLTHSNGAFLNLSSWWGTWWADSSV